MKVAVVGLPRSGTSATVGLLRILGFDLPPAQYVPRCDAGEAQKLRAPDGPVEPVVEALAQLPDNVVWKDPAVGRYADQVPWEVFDVVVRLERAGDDILDSERHWGISAPRGALAERNARWKKNLLANAPIDLTTSLEGIRQRPMLSMGALAAVTGEKLDEVKRMQAREFVKRQGGYICPIPDRCEKHSGKQTPRLPPQL